MHNKKETIYVQQVKPDEIVEEEVEQDATKDFISQIVGILSATLPILAILGISLDWFTQDFIDGVEAFLIALVPFAVNVWTIIKNHFVTQKEKEQNELLKKTGLKE